MINRKQERRSLPTAGDRRKSTKQPAKLDWGESAMPGTVRPGVGEKAPARERRRVPESGME